VFEGGPDMDRPVMTQQMAGTNFNRSNEEHIVHWVVSTDNGVYRYGVEAGPGSSSYEAIWAQLGGAGAACAATAETAAPIKVTDKVCARQGCTQKCPTSKHTYCSGACQKRVASQKDKQRPSKVARKYVKRRAPEDEDKMNSQEKAAYVQAATSTAELEAARAANPIRTQKQRWSWTTDQLRSVLPKTSAP
jgi:hypothetical protein